MLALKLNTEKPELVKEIREALKKNDGYCPCALVHEPDTKCMCKEFRDKVAAGYVGECHCGLFVNKQI